MSISELNSRAISHTTSVLVFIFIFGHEMFTSTKIAIVVMVVMVTTTTTTVQSQQLDLVYRVALPTTVMPAGTPGAECSIQWGYNETHLRFVVQAAISANRWIGVAIAEPGHDPLSLGGGLAGNATVSDLGFPGDPIIKSCLLISNSFASGNLNFCAQAAKLSGSIVAVDGVTTLDITRESIGYTISATNRPTYVEDVPYLLMCAYGSQGLISLYEEHDARGYLDSTTTLNNVSMLIPDPTTTTTTVTSTTPAVDDTTTTTITSVVIETTTSTSPSSTISVPVVATTVMAATTTALITKAQSDTTFEIVFGISAGVIGLVVTIGIIYSIYNAQSSIAPTRSDYEQVGGDNTFSSHELLSRRRRW